ncbi:SsgA family sporulation/cell division regulator [Streptomyces sp. NPDC019539]|uniref:SsgA family sporulation/cell division regulator n=1 Tax=Streptomyces sp. NPDC019539 TaxID=3365063 RepID=UPI0037A38C45
MDQEKPLGGAKEAIWWTEAVQIRAGMLLPIVTSFHYSSRDPYAARISFHPDPDNQPGITWCVERDLLWSGTRARSGTGDVQAWPAPGPAGAHYTLLQLGPPAGRALFRIDTAELREWLTLTRTLVAPGNEASYVDWQPLERLLTEHGAR